MKVAQAFILGHEDSDVNGRVTGGAWKKGSSTRATREGKVHVWCGWGSTGYLVMGDG